jgi:hypothetical protein
MATCTDVTLARWHAKTEPFAAEQMVLTAQYDRPHHVPNGRQRDDEAMRRLMDIVVTVRPSVLDLFGLPEWLPRRQSAAYRREIAEFDALVSRFLAERPADGSRGEPSLDARSPRVTLRPAKA